MGNLLKAKCACGAEYNNIPFGGVKSNFKTVCLIPAIHKETGKLEVVNYYEHVPKTVKKNFLQRWFGKSLQLPNPQYIFYNDQQLQTVEPEKYRNIGFGDVTLNNKQNFCPDCKCFTLDFEIVAYTD